MIIIEHLLLTMNVHEYLRKWRELKYFIFKYYVIILVGGRYPNDYKRITKDYRGGRGVALCGTLHDRDPELNTTLVESDDDDS